MRFSIDGVELPFTPERQVNDSFRWRHPVFYPLEAGAPIELRIEAADDPWPDASETEAGPPGVARYVSVYPEGPRKLGVYWETPSFDGGPDVVFRNPEDVTTYKIQWKEAAGSWDSPEDVSETLGNGTYHPILGLTEGVEYTVRVIATNEFGASPPSAEVTGTPREVTPPKLLTASVNGAALALTYDETLDGDSEPAAKYFKVKVGGDDRGVDLVAVESAVVALTLSSAVTPEDAVQVSYISYRTYPPVPVLRDAVGNVAPTFLDRKVTNITPQGQQGPADRQESNRNIPATGAPGISGTPRVGETPTSTPQVNPNTI